MKHYTVIRDFKNMNLSQAENLRARLSLSMSADTLTFCSNYYKTKLKRDPFLDEVKMMDMLTAAKKQVGASLSLTEYFTNDALVATTYADMLKKHKELHLEEGHPLTLAEAANVANEYLTFCRKQKKREIFHPYIEDAQNGTFYPDASCAAVANSPYRLRLLELADDAAVKKDVFVLICPAEEDNKSTFHRKVITFLQNDKLMQLVKNIATVGNGGILAELLHMANGAQIQLTALAIDGTPIAATSLCNQYSGCQILRIAKKRLKKVSAILESEGLRTIPFATSIPKPKFVFEYDEDSKFEIETHFLCSLTSYETVCAKPQYKSSRDFLTVLLDLLWNKVVSPLTLESTTQIGEVTQIDSHLCVASTATPVDEHYKTAVCSILAPVLSLCASGVPYDEQKLTVALEVPKNLSNDEVVSKYMSTVLGLYRAQMELKLTSQNSTFVQNDATASTPSIYVWAIAENAKKIPSLFTKPDSFVYAVTPAFDNDGLPDFGEFRQTLNSIAKLARKGKILSSRVLWDETIIDGIREMSSAYSCDITEKNFLNEVKLPLCILIESNKRLPWRCVGKVLPWNA